MLASSPSPTKKKGGGLFGSGTKDKESASGTVDQLQKIVSLLFDEGHYNLFSLLFR